MTTEPIRIMAVDDSAVIRGLWARLLDAEPDMRVVAAAWNGKAALDVLRRRPVDVVLLDIEMPEMNGIEALPKILAAHPGVRVIMASSLTLKGAEITVRALSLGASDFVTKPEASRMGNALEAVGKELVAKIRALVPGRSRSPTRPVATPSRPTGDRVRRSAHTAPRVVGVTSSTGGPNALTEVLSALPGDFPLPILIVQHMPALFTTMLAERLHRATARPCTEVDDGMAIEAGHTYVARGDRHMVVRERKGREYIELTDDAPENFCKPSADPMLRSMAQVYGPSMLTVVLTGMGHDGLAGARAVSDAGGHIIVQDEATSVVWGMPGAVATAGLADEILPLQGIGSFIDNQARALR